MTTRPKAKVANRDHTLFFAGGSTLLMIVIGWAIRSEPVPLLPIPATVSSAVHEQLPVKKPEVVMNEWN